jgi:hypothetical protein
MRILIEHEPALEESFGVEPAHEGQRLVARVLDDLLEEGSAQIRRPG